MFTLLKLATLVLLKSHQITDAHSLRLFLRELLLLTKSLAAETQTQIDDALLKPVEFMVNHDALFEHAYRLILAQLQTHEILLESAEKEKIVELVENTAQSNTEFPGAIDPVVIVSIITQIISLINSIKNQ